jgi:GTPase involved in cell partitioning and DNA repair
MRAAAAAVYDVTRAETFTDLESIWMKEVDIYSNVEAAVKMVVANKVDLVRATCSACLAVTFLGSWDTSSY